MPACSSASEWQMVDGATWAHPLGPNEPRGAGRSPRHPGLVERRRCVLLVAEGKRLPTEVEWEHAARGATNAPNRYAWGDSLEDADGYHANTWTGTFPVRNTAADGFRLTSPVGHFGATPLGLTDMGGNVWEWTADWYRSYADRDAPFTPTAESERVQRGGSFLCHESYCHGYRVSARSHSTPETSLFHVGFRCAKRCGGDRMNLAAPLGIALLIGMSLAGLARADEGARLRVTLNDGWRFAYEPDGEPAAPGFDDAGWQRVALPHTWNAEDAFDKTEGYRRGTGWYRKPLRLDPALRRASGSSSISKARIRSPRSS